MTIEDRIKNAATVILKSDYPEYLKIKLQEAFEKGEFQTVLDLAADHDVPGREKLDSKIRMIPNPKFQESEDGNLVSETVDNMVDAVLNKESKDETKEEEKLRKEGRMYELEYDEPRFLFEVEGIEGTFKSAAKATVAYQKKYNESPKAPEARHSFRRNPKFVTPDSPPEDVVQAIPKKPTEKIE